MTIARSPRARWHEAMDVTAMSSAARRFLAAAAKYARLLHELPPDELQTALTLADGDKAPQLREELMAYFSEGGDRQNHDHLIAKNRGVAAAGVMEGHEQATLRVGEIVGGVDLGEALAGEADGGDFAVGSPAASRLRVVTSLVR